MGCDLYIYYGTYFKCSKIKADKVSIKLGYRRKCPTCDKEYNVISFCPEDGTKLESIFVPADAEIKFDYYKNKLRENIAPQDDVRYYIPNINLKESFDVEGYNEEFTQTVVNTEKSIAEFLKLYGECTEELEKEFEKVELVTGLITEMSC